MADTLDVGRSKMDVSQELDWHQVLVLSNLSTAALSNVVVELLKAGEPDPLLGPRRRCCRQLDDGVLPGSHGAAKVVVFCADPRLGVDSEAGLQNETFAQHGPVGRSIRAVAQWAELESSWPEQVGLFFVEDFVSDAEATLRHLVQFLGLRALSSEVFARLHDDASRGAAQIAEMQHELPRLGMPQHPEELFMPWLSSPNASLTNLAERLLQEIASQGSARLAPPIAAGDAHDTGTCNPCIFAMRGACINGEACLHCHVPGHSKPKRASKRKRDQKRNQFARLLRTPSPEWRAEGAEPSRSLPALTLPSHTCMQPVIAQGFHQSQGFDVHSDQQSFDAVLIPIYWN